MAYISNCLTHWVGRRAESNDLRYDLLVNTILARQELLFSPCPWQFSTKYGGITKDGGIIKVAFPIIAFTDIPFTEVGHHCTHYSPFGISLAKHYLVNCLASPVAYALNPFIFQAYSDLMHDLFGISSLVDGKIIPEGRHKGEKCDTKKMRACVQAMAVWFLNYDQREYEFNEVQPHPHRHQEFVFDRPDALYYEREWRMVERHGSKFPWDEYRDGRHYFRFEPQYVRFIIMPRAYLSTFSADAAVCLQKYPRPLPPVLAFEDLSFF